MAMSYCINDLLSKPSTHSDSKSKSSKNLYDTFCSTLFKQNHKCRRSSTNIKSFILIFSTTHVILGQKISQNFAETLKYHVYSIQVYKHCDQVCTKFK